MPDIDRFPVLAIEAHVARLFLSGQAEQAQRLLEESGQLATHGRIAFQHALIALERRQWHVARRSLDHVLRLCPGYLPALHKRGTLHTQIDNLDAALVDFQSIVSLTPHDASALANAGVILLRRQAHAEALPLLERAYALLPDNPQVLRSLANALSGTGQHSRALTIFARLEQAGTALPGLACDHALALLCAGQAHAAHRRYLAQVATDPGDQWAWAGRYLSAAALDLPETRALMDYDVLLGRATLSSLATNELHDAVLALPDLRWEPAGKSTVQGQQSTMLDLAPGSAFHAFGQQIHFLLSERLRQLTDIADDIGAYAWLSARPSQWRLQAWATILHGGGGQQYPHIHPAGWLSGVFYLDAGDAALGQGDLLFGHPPSIVPIAMTVHEHRHTASAGSVLTFPSYFLHHTTPYHGQRPRISLAFDLVPLRGP